jgi:dUTPase
MSLPVCQINIEKSTTALFLEQKLGIEWGFSNDNPLDTFYYLKAAITEPINIGIGAVVPIPTGIYPQLINPSYEIEVRSYTDLTFERGLCLADGITYFNYGFRNEIWVLLENKFKTVQTILPAQKIAIFSVVERPSIVIKYVEQIEKSPWKIRSNSYIQKLKNQLRKPQKQDKESEYYSDRDIETYLKDKI